MNRSLDTSLCTLKTQKLSHRHNATHKAEVEIIKPRSEITQYLSVFKYMS